MNDEKPNKLKALEDALAQFGTQLEQRTEKLREIREHFPELKNKANILKARLQEELNRRGHEYNLKVNVREVGYDEVKNEPDVLMSKNEFQKAPEYFKKYFILEVIHTKIQLADKEKGGVIYKEHFPVIEIGETQISAFLDEIKSVDGLIPYLDSILGRDLEGILERMNTTATKAVQENLETLKKNS